MVNNQISIFCIKPNMEIAKYQNFYILHYAKYGNCQMSKFLNAAPWTWTWVVDNFHIWHDTVFTADDTATNCDKHQKYRPTRVCNKIVQKKYSSKVEYMYIYIYMNVSLVIPCFHKLQKLNSSLVPSKLLFPWSCSLPPTQTSERPSIISGVDLV